MRGKRVRGECIDSLHQLLAGGEKGRLGGNARRLLEHHGNQLQLHACMYQIRDDYKAHEVGGRRFILAQRKEDRSFFLQEGSAPHREQARLKLR